MKTASQGILNFSRQSLIFLQILSTYAKLERASRQNRPQFILNFKISRFFLFLDSSCIWIFITSYSMQIMIFAYDNMLLAVQVSLPKFLEHSPSFF